MMEQLTTDVDVRIKRNLHKTTIAIQTAYYYCYLKSTNQWMLKRGNVYFGYGQRAQATVVLADRMLAGTGKRFKVVH